MASNGAAFHSRWAECRGLCIFILQPFSVVLHQEGRAIGNQGEEQLRRDQLMASNGMAFRSRSVRCHIAYAVKLSEGRIPTELSAPA